MQGAHSVERLKRCLHGVTAMQAQLITEKELAGLTRCSVRHLINLRNRRLIPYVRLGKSVRYNPEHVKRAIDKLTVIEIS
jgi:Helix-turn-helix domain